MFLICHGYEIDVPELIFAHMAHAIHSSRSTPLPFFNLLPIIFDFFNIDTSSDEQSFHKGTVDEGCLGRLGMVLNLKNQWIFKTAKKEAVAESVPETRFQALEEEIDNLRFTLNDVRRDISDRQDDTHFLLKTLDCKMNQLLLLQGLTFTATGSIMPLEKDACDYVREATGNIILECEQKVRDRPLLRPKQRESIILTVEEYGVVKKYRNDEKKRQLFEAQRNNVVREAEARWRWKAKSHVHRSYKGPKERVPEYGKWYEEK